MFVKTQSKNAPLLYKRFNDKACEVYIIRKTYRNNCIYLLYKRNGGKACVIVVVGSLVTLNDLPPQ